jgi:drug/metabolite transporter (DMT)-like permease
MSLTWVLLALSSTLISALVNILDSHFMSRRMPGWKAYVLICDLFALPVSIVMLLIFPLPAGIGFAPIAAVFASAMISSLSVVLILDVMRKEDVATVSPITSTAPVFVAILAILFLGEDLALHQWLAIAAVVTGAIAISFKWDARGGAHFHIRPFLILMAAAVLIAISNVFNKYGLGYMSYWNSATLIFFFSAVLFIGICFRPNVLREIASLRERTGTVGFTLANQIAAMVAAVLAYKGCRVGPRRPGFDDFQQQTIIHFRVLGPCGEDSPGISDTREKQPQTAAGPRGRDHARGGGAAGDAFLGLSAMGTPAPG